jgi:hypothetical protein
VSPTWICAIVRRPSSTPRRRPTGGGDDSDDDDDNDRFFATVNIEGRTRALEAPPTMPLLACPECRAHRWGAVRVVVRAIANLPSKNFLNHASDPYVKAELIDWLRGTRSGYWLKTQTLDDVLSGTFRGERRAGWRRGVQPVSARVGAQLEQLCRSQVWSADL